MNAKGAVVALPGYEDRFAAQKTVCWAERGAWADAAQHFRLHESDSQIAALRSGMSAVVPIALLPLFSWKELELQVTGRCVASVASVVSVAPLASLASHAASVQALYFSNPRSAPRSPDVPRPNLNLDLDRALCST